MGKLCSDVLHARKVGAAQDDATAAEIRRVKTALQDTALEAFARGDTAKLMQGADILTTLSNKQAKVLTAKYRDKIEEVRANETGWSNVFRSVYVFGAFCLGVNFIRTRLTADNPAHARA